MASFSESGSKTWITFSDEFSFLLQCVPYWITRLGIYTFNLLKDTSHIGSIGKCFVRTILYLLFVTAQLCIFLDVTLLRKTQRTDYCQWHLFHLHYSRHRREWALIELVEHGGMNDVVHMMAESNLIEIGFLSEAKKWFTTMPWAKEALGLMCWYGLVKWCGNNV